MTTSLTVGHFLFKPNSTSSKEKINKRQPLIHLNCNYFHFYFETLEEKISQIAKICYSEMSDRICHHLTMSLGKIQTRPFRIFPSIPTVAIISGINKADHNFMYEQLHESLTSQLSKATIILNSRNSPNLKACWKHIFTTLYDKLNIDCTDIDIIKHTPGMLKELLKPATVGSVRSSLILILVFEEFEAMPDKVVNHVLLCLNEYVNEFPILIVVNIAIFVNALHEKLTWNASSLLDIKVFEVTSSQNLINKIVKDLITNPSIPFMLAPNLIAWLLTHFSMYNLSISQFSHNTKVALHYHMKTRGFLEDTFSEKIDLDSISTDRTYLIQSIAQVSNKEAGKGSGKRKVANKVPQTTSQVQQLFDWYEVAVGLAASLYELLQVMGKEIQLFAKDYHTIYILLLNGDLIADENFQGVLKYLGSTVKQQLLTDCVNACLKELRETMETIKTEKEKASLEKTMGELNIIRDHLESTVGDLPMSLKSDVVLVLKRLITDYFLPRNPMKHPLAHIAFCHVPENMNQLVDPSILNSVHEDLTKTTDATGEKESVANRPPVCTVYRLMTESGKFVNLYDWYQSFQFCHEGNNSDLIQAKFFSAVAELEFLGIIKPDKRKIDHVQKLTHGLF